MRNIHIFKTDRPTRLHWYTYGEFGLSKKHLPWKEGRNIYITNDKEIKNGDWYLTSDHKILKCKKVLMSIIYAEGDYGRNPNGCQKIILTTDQDLIENGVQPIDDEFLEWFIKNPSCVFIKTYPLGNNKYDMVIPQVAHNEEPKQDLREFPLTPDECYKQETLEELTERHHPIDVRFEYSEELLLRIKRRREYFIDGYKAAQERMYSEQEVIELLTKRCKHFGTSVSPFDKLLLKQDLEWFNEFKKL